MPAIKTCARLYEIILGRWLETMPAISKRGLITMTFDGLPLEIKPVRGLGGKLPACAL